MLALLLVAIHRVWFITAGRRESSRAKLLPENQSIQVGCTNLPVLGSPRQHRLSAFQLFSNRQIGLDSTRLDSKGSTHGRFFDIGHGSTMQAFIK